MRGADTLQESLSTVAKLDDFVPVSSREVRRMSAPEFKHGRINNAFGLPYAFISFAALGS